MAKKRRDPFDVKLTSEQKKELALWLVNEVQAGIDAKGTVDKECDYWHLLYEQGRTRGRNAPWPDAADLTSYLAAEKVDALHARLMRTINVEPMWTVEGWGEAAMRAPFVEEFHQWKQEEERLQAVLDRLALMALIEPRALLEVSEGTDTRVVRKRISAALDVVVDPMTGQPLPIFDEDGNPKLLRDETGALVEAQASEPAAETVVDAEEKVRTGPQYRILPYPDSLILPGHAREKDEIWCYGKRCWVRLVKLQQEAAKGVYDSSAVADLTETGEREPDQALTRAGQAVAPQERATAEKELWELLILVDLAAVLSKHTLPREARGERWYCVTLHLGQQIVLRVQHDDLERSRFVLVILFPRPDRATEGFSLVGHKLITIIEEHTAWRNMLADRAAMQVQMPIKRQVGALWDPIEQPFGPKAVIDVRDMREVEPMDVPDLTQPIFEHVQMMERNAERVAGVTDVAAGNTPTEDRTLGEVQLVTEQAFVRMDLIIRRFQEALEDLFQIRHAIWKRVLAESDTGMEAPSSVLVGLEMRGTPLAGGIFEASMLDGTFRGKPRGSVETADPNRLRFDFVQAMQALPGLVQAFPASAFFLQQPTAARAMFEHFIRVFRIPNKQAFLGSPAQDMALGGGMMPGMLGPMGLPPLAPVMGMGVPPLPLPPSPVASSTVVQ